MQNFEDQVILITGAASGFGKILAEKLAASGAKLVLGDINEHGVKSLSKSLPGESVALNCNVTNKDEVNALTEAAINTFGHLDIAINNAGIATPLKSFLDTSEKEMDLSFSVNTKGVLFGMQSQIPAMQARGQGCILNIASMAGLIGAPTLTAYVAAKHATVGLTKTAALEFAKDNIRINALCPFYSPTPLVDGLSKDEKYLNSLARISPMKRLGTPEEMVSAMLLIIDPANTYMTGQAIAVDGGISAA